MNIHPDHPLADDVRVLVRAAEAGAFDEPTLEFHRAWRSSQNRGDARALELKNAWKRALWDVAAGLLGCDEAQAKVLVDLCVSRGLIQLWNTRVP